MYAAEAGRLVNRPDLYVNRAGTVRTRVAPSGDRDTRIRRMLWVDEGRRTESNPLLTRVPFRVALPGVVKQGDLRAERRHVKTQQAGHLQGGTRRRSHADTGASCSLSRKRRPAAPLPVLGRCASCARGRLDTG